MDKLSVDLFDKFFSNFNIELLFKFLANLKVDPTNFANQLNVYKEFLKKINLTPEKLIAIPKELETKIKTTLDAIAVLRLTRENRIEIRISRLPFGLDPKEKVECYYQILATDGAYGNLDSLFGQDQYTIPGPEELGNYKVHDKISDESTVLCLWILEPKNPDSPPILLFRGTAHHRNWDQNFSPEIGKAGFELLENRILESIDRLYAQTHPHRIPPVIVGHSLGGALSQRAILSLIKNRPKYLWNPEIQQRAQVYLYASPGVGQDRLNYEELLVGVQHPPFIVHIFEEVDVVPLTGGQTLPLDKAVVMNTYEKWNSVGAHLNLPLPYTLTEGKNKQTLIKGVDDDMLKMIEQRGLLQERLRTIVVAIKIFLGKPPFS